MGEQPELRSRSTRDAEVQPRQRQLEARAGSPSARRAAAGPHVLPVLLWRLLLGGGGSHEALCPIPPAAVSQDLGSGFGLFPAIQAGWELPGPIRAVCSEHPPCQGALWMRLPLQQSHRSNCFRANAAGCCCG